MIDKNLKIRVASVNYIDMRRSSQTRHNKLIYVNSMWG